MSSPIGKIIQQNIPDFASYESLYKYYHANPELSFQEKDTAASIASELSKLGVKRVHQHIGGHGLAGVIENGPGKIVLLRADFDALPVQERTGLEYASKKLMKDLEGNEKPVMHACGHDMHITALLATAELMLKAKSEWTGTLLLCFQPAEEKAAGARAMVEDGLYDKIPKPDVVLGAHVFPHRAGVVATRRGPFMAAADSFHLTLHGRGSHGSQPHRGCDPVVMAASTVMRLQTIASREVDPGEVCVVTVGASNSGDAENVIPFRADLKINVRTFNPEVRPRVLASIKRIVEAESMASNAPAPPELTGTSSFPLTVNDDEVTARLEETFSAHFPPAPHGYLQQADRAFGSEDFGLLGSMIDRPYSFFVYGGTDPEIWDKAVKEGKVQDEIPVNHSPFFAPVIQPTLRVGVEAYAAAALTWLAKK